ncbi:hypothetical protein Y032_0233g3103 [Ancylostoma ceylanicum]|uniref:Uncharacterized protein n=1 Tax=Ancylostoma ceylanicum TaxID=53326 RepID=A0A016SG49_9BILA|nr:hypothetical protein Y032_0233g3103 [Ancylostoma ceylanicum]
MIDIIPLECCFNIIHRNVIDCNSGIRIDKIQWYDQLGRIIDPDYYSESIKPWSECVQPANQQLPLNFTMMMHSLIFLAGVCFTTAVPAPQEISKLGLLNGHMEGDGQQLGLTGPPMGQMGGFNGQTGFSAPSGRGSGQPQMGGAAPQLQ